jgi:murein DD-endopeptidase MepM/ murein hydrolase activator NlpD
MASRNKSRLYTFLLLTDDDASTWSISIRRVWIRFAAAIATVFIIIISVVLITYANLLSTAVAHKDLEEKYEYLIAERQKIRDIASEVERLKQYKSKIYKSLTGYVDVQTDAHDSLLMDSKIAETSILLKDDLAGQNAIINRFPFQPPLKGYITRKLELRGGDYNHYGIDVAAALGSPIKPAGAGIVIFSGWNDLFGKMIIVLHNDGFHTHYAHCDQLLVKAGDLVTPETVIATAGSTGDRSTAVHLHFELWHREVPLDPLIFIEGFF